VLLGSAALAAIARIDFWLAYSAMFGSAKVLVKVRWALVIIE
jgi:hypothetical protein